MELEQRNGSVKVQDITGDVQAEALSGPFAQLKSCTPLEGIKLGGRGKDLRVGQRLRVSISYKGHMTETFPVTIKGRIYGLEGDEPQIVLEDKRYVKGILLVPESAMANRGYEIWSFRRLKPNSNEVKRQEREREALKTKPVALAYLPKRALKTFRIAQFVEGVTPEGKRATFFISRKNEETGRFLLESLDHKNAKKNGELQPGRFGAQMIQDYTIVRRSAVRSAESIREAFEKGFTPIGSPRRLSQV